MLFDEARRHHRQFTPFTPLCVFHGTTRSPACVLTQDRRGEREGASRDLLLVVITRNVMVVLLAVLCVARLCAGGSGAEGREILFGGAGCRPPTRKAKARWYCVVDFLLGLSRRGPSWWCSRAPRLAKVVLHGWRRGRRRVVVLVAARSFVVIAYYYE